MQGDWLTFEGPAWSCAAIPLALFVRPSPLKGGPTRRLTFEGPAWSRAAIPLAHFVRPSPLIRGTDSVAIWRLAALTVSGGGA